MQLHGLQQARLSCPSLSPKFAQTHVFWVGDAFKQSHPLSSSSPALKIYVFIYGICLSLSVLLHCIRGSRFIQLIRSHLNVFLFMAEYYCIVYMYHLYAFICWWTSRLLPCPSYCKECCNEHWGTCVFLNYGYLRVYRMSLSMSPSINGHRFLQNWLRESFSVNLWIKFHWSKIFAECDIGHLIFWHPHSIWLHGINFVCLLVTTIMKSPKWDFYVTEKK